MLTLSDLFARGAIFALHCGSWRARESISPSDLGLNDAPTVRRALALGAVKLAPPDALAPVLAIQRAAAQAITENSLNFRMIPGARYVPAERTENLSLILDQLRQKHAEAVATEFSDESYRTIVTTQLAEVYKAIREALRMTHGSVEANTVAERAIERLTRELLPADEVRRRFYLRWNVYVIDAVDNDLVDQLSGTQGEVSDVLGGMIEGLRKDVSERLSEVVSLVSRGGKWTEKTVRSAEEVLDRAERMNILNDATLRTAIASARKLIAAYDPKGSNTGFVEDLSAVANAIESDTAAAVAAAERELMSYSQRKITRKEAV
jgi:hypothetical protein